MITIKHEVKFNLGTVEKNNKTFIEHKLYYFYTNTYYSEIKDDDDIVYWSDEYPYNV